MRGSSALCVVSLSSLVLYVVACDAPAPQPPSRTLVSEDVGVPVRATLGATGGVLETTQDGVTYALRVPAGALAADVELVLTPARLVGIEGSVGARFEPDGLAFLAPATMIVSPPPAGDVLVALQDGPIPGEASLAVSLPTGALFAVSHFSTHAAANAAAAESALPADVLAAARGLAGVPAREVAAIALGIFFDTHVAPLLPLATRDVRGFEIAATAAEPWLAAALTAPDDVRALPHVRGGGESVEDLADRVVRDLVTAGLGLHRRLTPPECSGTPDIAGVLDWARLSTRVQSLLVSLGELADPGTCLRSRVTVTGPTTMTSTTRELDVRLRFFVQGPPADPRTVPSDASFSIAAVGATGPTDIEDGNGGDVRSVVFVRELGPERARVVTLTVNALSAEAQLAFIPEPEPAVFTAVEAGTAIALTAVPATLSSPSETSRLCVGATLDGEPLQSFTASFTRQGPGSLEVEVVATDDGAACTTYVPPSPLPANGGEALITARVTIAGSALEQRVAIALGTSTLDLDVVATPDEAAVAGGALAVCAGLTSGGVPVSAFDIQFALAGPGALDEVGVISVNRDDGRACVAFTAPTPLLAGQSATVSAHATVGALSADGSVVIPFVDAPAPLTSIYEGRWVGSATNAWSDTSDNGTSPESNTVVTTEQTGSGTFDISCTLSPPPNEFLDRISTCTITNHVGTASYEQNKDQGPYLCEIVTNQNVACAAETSCVEPHDCLIDPGTGNGRCALCLGTGFTDEVQTHDSSFDIAAEVSGDSALQVLAESGATRVFWRMPQVGALGHFRSLRTCATEGPDCSGATTAPSDLFEVELSALSLPALGPVPTTGELPVELVAGGTLSGTVTVGAGTASFTLHHVP